jgi:hypothetical protein
MRSAAALEFDRCEPLGVVVLVAVEAKRVDVELPAGEPGVRPRPR